MQTYYAVHLGFGAFHRAHQLNYTQLVNDLGEENWRYYEVNLRTGIPIVEKLRQQDFHYHLLEQGNQGATLKPISVIEDAFHPAISGIESILETIADPKVSLVSLTITEKGYSIDPVTGQLDLSHPDINADIHHPRSPKTAIGYLVEALRRRYERGEAGFTVLSCDNLMENGKVAQNAVLGLAKRQSPDLTRWIEEKVTFPCTMVDRIVPAVTEETRVRIAKLLGKDDPCGVESETFSQWIIENKFIYPRPKWEKAGATLVKDVRPFEQMKLRMLNGSHSLLAYLGYLAGFEYISDAMQDANFYQLTRQFMLNAQAPTLKNFPDINLEAYADTLLERFQNPHIKHRTWQIAMDGSQKLPPRFLASIPYHLAHNTDFSLLALGVAGWMRYVAGIDEKGNLIDMRDPMAERLAMIYQAHGLNLSVVDALLDLSQIFPRELRQNPRFVKAVKDAYQALLTHGAKQTVCQSLKKGAKQ